MELMTPALALEAITESAPQTCRPTYPLKPDIPDMNPHATKDFVTVPDLQARQVKDHSMWVGSSACIFAWIQTTLYA